MKKIVKVAFVLMLCLLVTGCKEYKTTECVGCGNTKQCYKVTWIVPGENREESHFVCSKKCENDVNALMTLYGAKKK